MKTNQQKLQTLQALLTNQLNKNLKKYIKPDTAQYKLLLTSKIAEEYLNHYKQYIKETQKWHAYNT